MGEVVQNNGEQDYLEGSKATTVTASDIYEALVESEGNISRAAAKLGVSRSWVQKKIDTNVTLLAMLQDRREAVVDQAETNVFADVYKNDPTANRFVLQSIGKERGWSSGVGGTGKNGEIVVVINKLGTPDGA
jgi:hypothetical protein